MAFSHALGVTVLFGFAGFFLTLEPSCFVVANWRERSHQQQDDASEKGKQGETYGQEHEGMSGPLFLK